MKNLLERVGWTQSYFAKRIGVSDKTVSRWVKGNENPVAKAYLELVARMLGV